MVYLLNNKYNKIKNFINIKQCEYGQFENKILSRWRNSNYKIFAIKNSDQEIEKTFGLLNLIKPKILSSESQIPALPSPRAGIPARREGREGRPALHLSLKKLSKFWINNRVDLTSDEVKKEENKRLIDFEYQGVIRKHESRGSDRYEKIKKYYTSYSKLSEVKLLTIGIASPLRILQWAEKTLPNGKIYGEVLNANTLHHKTFKPQKGGLFCERIFGPLKDFECACGKTNKSVKKIQTDSKRLFLLKKVENNNESNLNLSNSNLDSSSLNGSTKISDENKMILDQPLFDETKGFFNFHINRENEENTKISRKFCADCDVEYTWSVIRRYQLGFIKLSSPITHIWFLKGTPSYLSLLLDIKKRYLQFVTYCSETLTIEKSSLPFYSSRDSYEENLTQSSFLNENKIDLTSPLIDTNQTVSMTLEQPLILTTKSSNQTNQLSTSSAKENLFKIVNNNTTNTKIKQNTVSKQILNTYHKKCILLRENKIKEIKEKRSNIITKHQKGWHLNLLFKKDSNDIYELKIYQSLALASKKNSNNEFNLYFHNINSKKLNNDESQLKVITRKNKKGSFILSTLLVSVYYKYLTNFLKLQSEELKSVQYLKNLFKKLPLDLYILCSLEGLFHQSSIFLAMKKGWEIIYKKAFLKAMKKSKITLTKFIVLNQNYFEVDKSLDASFLVFSTKGQNPKGSLPALPSLPYGIPARREGRKGLGGPGDQKEILTQNKDKIILSKPNKILNTRTEIVNYFKSQKNRSLKKEIIKSDTSFPPFPLDRDPCPKGREGREHANLASIVNQNKFALNSLKNKYTTHVIKLLKHLRYPILSVNYTTLLFNNNSVLQIEKSIETEMINYLLNNTEHLEKILSELLFNSLLLDQFVNMFDKKNNFNATYFNTNNFPKYSLLLDTSLCSLVFSTKKPIIKNEILKFKLISILNAFKRFKKLNKTKTLPLSLPFPASLPSRTGSLPEGKGGQGREGRDGETTKDNILEKNSITFDSLIRKDSFKNLTNIYNHKKKIFNNVYTISHRERWDIDKDWYTFSMFTFGITEYTDFPIYNYQNRFISLTTLQDNTYNTYFSAFTNVFLTDDLIKTDSSNKNVGGVQTLNSNIEPISSNFIYSSSFYSGAGIVQQLLNEFDFNEIQKLDKQNRLLLYQLNKSILKLKKLVQIFVYDKNAQMKLKELCKKRDLLIRRTKLVRKIFRKNTNPSSMILTVIPVLPPDLRPIVKMGNQIAASDLNRLYQRVIYRNDRLKKFLKDPATSQSFEMKYAQRLLQEAVDNLMQNGKSGPNSEKDARGRALKSLSDILKGKQGRFRQFLLGKRVDYSGRSVIVVGPKLKLHECGLPQEMAKELYLPFLLKSILNKNFAKTVVGAKTLIQNDPSLANELLHEIMQVTPILLNRAPTLHRLGIQAFVPKLIQGRAILLHPLVCSAFNADFDGDQMAVHVPITVEARAEAWKMMLSRNNLLSPATGEPLAIPSQDMVLGCYYLTTFSNKSKILRGAGMYFNNLYDVIKLYEQQLIDIHAFVWVKWTHLIQNGNDFESPLEIRVSPIGNWQEITSNYQKVYDFNNELINLYMCTTPGRILFNLILQESFFTNL